MKFLLAVVFVLALARVINCGIFADEFDDDYYGNEECYEKCDNTRACKELDRAPRNRAKRCLTYLEDRCYDADNSKKCLDNLAKRRTSRCPSSILKNAIPCLKCENDCEEDDYYYGGGYLGPDIGDRDLTSEEKKCLDKCNATTECITLYKASSVQIDKCKAFADDTCGQLLELVDCLGLTQSVSSSKCPQSFRKEALTCMKCEDKCLGAEEDPIDKIEDAEDKCIEECAKTPSCMIFDGASKQRIESCMALTKARCENDDEDKILECLESIADVSSIGCPKVFRKSAIECLKCDNKCTATASAEANKHMLTLDGGNKCEAKCDELTECKALNDAPFETEFVCNMFVLIKCAMSDNVTQCVANLSDDEDIECPASYRKNMIKCMACDEKCDEMYEGEKKEDMEECLDECSETSSCIEVDYADGKLMRGCKTFTDKYCGGVDDTIGCLDASTRNDAMCPMGFRRKLVECMKCDKQCESPKTMPKYGTCAYERMQAMKGEMMIGKPIPQCDAEGNYKTRQCSSSSGYCWCVDKMSGKELEGTQTPPGRPPANCDVPMPKKGTCAYARMQAMKGGMMPGKFIPQCDSDGNYKTQQCSGSSGYCWCVDKMMGKELEGTKTPPGRPAANCDAPMPKKGTCAYARMQAMKGGMMPGKFIPQCDSDGNYKTQQCSGSSGYCWCVDKMMGKELEGTRTPPGGQALNCDAPDIIPPPTSSTSCDKCAEFCTKKRNVIKPDCMTCIKAECDGSKEPGCVKNSIEGGCRSRCFLDEEAARKKSCTECTNNCTSTSDP